MGIAMATMDPSIQTGGREHSASNAAPTPGRLRENGLSPAEKQFAIWTHLLMPIGAIVSSGMLTFLGPLIIWLARKDISPFNDDHGREALNFLISFVILHVALGITVVGIVFMPVLWVVGLIGVIRAAVAANRGEYFRYPMTIRFLS